MSKYRKMRSMLQVSVTYKSGTAAYPYRTVRKPKFTERGCTWKQRLSQRSRIACHICIIMLLIFFLLASRTQQACNVR